MTQSQDRLVEYKLARKINFDDIVSTFPVKKARKAFLNN